MPDDGGENGWQTNGGFSEKVASDRVEIKVYAFVDVEVDDNRAMSIVDDGVEIGGSLKCDTKFAGRCRWKMKS